MEKKIEQINKNSNLFIGSTIVIMLAIIVIGFVFG
jgi:hypothetical protein